MEGSLPLAQCIIAATVFLYDKAPLLHIFAHERLVGASRYMAAAKAL